MSSSLLPERPLLLSPTLAATIGLEEAIMVQALSEALAHRPALARPGDGDHHWVALTWEEMEKLFPFWQAQDLERIQASLKSLGLILVEPDIQDQRRFFLAIDEADLQTPTPTSTAIPALTPTRTPIAPPAPTPPPAQPAMQTAPGSVPQQPVPTAGAASRIPANWQPDDNWVRLCRQHAIPDQFINALIPEFINYWRERGQAKFSWGNAFYKHALREWREEQTRQGAWELASNMSADWRPSADALEILVNSGVSGEFIEDAVPEFVLYWRERGVVHGAWNTKFIEHIRRQWAKYSASFGRDDTPQPISEDWQPSAECYEILQLAEIDENYARSRVPEFVMYWRDSGQARASWNTIFLQFIKQDWARQLKQQESADYPHAENQAVVGSSEQRIKEKFQRIADRSWAD